MTTLTFHGAVNEIGGNKVLLEDQDTKILLDFGMSFSQHDKYFADFLKPRKCNTLGDFLRTGLLPKLSGIYRQDYLQHIGYPEETKSLDGVLITHAHMDHAAYIHFLRKDIPLFMSPGSFAILRTLEDTGVGFFKDMIHHRQDFLLRDMKTREGKTKCRGSDRPKTVRPITVIKSGNKFQIGTLSVLPLSVDHSIPGATAFIIFTSQGSILYTGDFRFHGYHADETSKMVEEATKNKIDIVISEGTRIDQGSGTTESDVYKEVKNIVKKTDELAIVNFPRRDLSRLITFYQVAKETGRKLVLTLDQAYLLEEFSKFTDEFPTIDDPTLAFYAPRKGWGVYGCGDPERWPENIQFADYNWWEQKYLDQPNVFTYQEVQSQQDKLMFYCNYFQLNSLIDLEPNQGSSYIRSITEPFDEEAELKAERVKNWLNLFGLTLYGLEPTHKIHASGHASGTEIIDVLKTINPKTIIPIHTEHPSIFQKKLPQSQLISKGKPFTF